MKKRDYKKEYNKRKNYHQEYRLKHIDQYKNHLTKWRLKNADSLKKVYKSYYYKTREKQLARSILRQSIKDKRMIKGVCLFCGDPKTEGHHTDYTKPLEVIWLCRKHHVELHMKLK